MTQQNILEIKNLTISFDTDKGLLRVVNSINFQLHAGETLGLVGESGSGKSVTSLAIMRLLKRSRGIIEGDINFEGENLLDLPVEKFRPLRGDRISMIFQEPMTSLNPVFTVGNQLMEVFRLHQGMDKEQAEKASIDALRMVQVPAPERRIKAYPYQLSGGLRQRVMIAMALACRPAVLIADEPTTALDVTIQAQVLDLMRDLKDRFGTSILFITHDLGVVSEMCSRVVVMYCGEIMEQSPTNLLFDKPLHPYTQGLLAALPQIGKKEKLYVIPGSVPAPSDFPEGCVFAPRCPHAFDRCHKEKPRDTRRGERIVRCFLYTEGGDTQ